MTSFMNDPSVNLSLSGNVIVPPNQNRNSVKFCFQARHIYICDVHKSLIQSLRTKRKRKESDDDSAETDSEYPGNSSLKNDVTK